MHLEPHSFVHLYLVLMLCLCHISIFSFSVMISKHIIFARE